MLGVTKIQETVKNVIMTNIPIHVIKLKINVNKNVKKLITVNVMELLENVISVIILQIPIVHRKKLIVTAPAKKYMENAMIQQENVRFVTEVKIQIVNKSNQNVILLAKSFTESVMELLELVTSVIKTKIQIANK